ncbi:mediator complex subunit Med5-domain-containing protein [Absidia repens]|uniref:Mediator of RNA polymerase II transcription subunit 5 n=1 Tax=Absidia repens TaxID=90262 RepID=A0A1X2IIK3_9FUNG|nr:mediator complex subunit Med5-domain-containing protein [Absidia repens]
MSVSSLEKVLRYACTNGYTCTEWADPVKHCLQLSEQDLSQDLCDLLLKHFFSASRAYSMLLGSYLTYTLTGETPPTTQTVVINKSKSLVNSKQFLSQLTRRDLHFAFSQEYNNHWAYILHLLPSLVSEVDDDLRETLSWAPILSKLLVILSQVVMVGLYPQRKSNRQLHKYGQDDDMGDSDNDDMVKQPEDDLTASQLTLEDDLTQSQQLNFSVTNNTYPFANDSQMTIDPDAPFDADATQPDPYTEQQDLKKDTNSNNYGDILPPGTANTAVNAVYNSQNDLLHRNSIQANQHQYQHPSQSSSLYPNSWGESASALLPMEKTSLEWENAISAAKIIIDLIEKKGVKRIIEKFAQERKEEGIEINSIMPLDLEDTWATCREILIPDNPNSRTTTATTVQLSSEKSTSATGAHSNMYIQKLLFLLERLADRDLERQLAIHMKYHELEDEGTARAMPRADVMGLVYHMVQISPALDDDEVVSRLIKLQAIKGSFDEAFYLEIWFAALTGLREASLSINCQNMKLSNITEKQHLDHGDQNICDRTVSTNRLLWKNLVLVKLPHIINRLHEHKEKEKLANYSLKRGKHPNASQNVEPNVIELSLMKLKTFTGLLNACSPSACCYRFYVPLSKPTTFVNRLVSSGVNDDDGDNDDDDDGDDDDDDRMMDMINNSSYGTPKVFNSSAFVKAIRTINTDDIFASIVRSCQPYNFLHNSKIDILLDKMNAHEDTDHKSIKTEHYNGEGGGDHFGSTKPMLKKHLSYASLFGDLDDTIMSTDTPDQEYDSSGKLDVVTQIDQNIEQRFKSIQSNTSQESLSELIHIGLVSLVHWRKIVDFVVKLLSEKARSGDIRGLSRLCGALSDCPPAIKLILQLHPPSALLCPLESVCNEWNPSDDLMDVDDDFSGNGDNGIDDNGDDEMNGVQSWYYKFGKIWTFVLVVANKFDIAYIINRIFKNRNGLCYQFFVTGSVIYAVDAHDEEVEDTIDCWLSAMGGDGISDDLLRTTNVQMLIRATPSIIDRLLCIYNTGKIELETLTGVLSYFRRRFLQFLLVAGVTQKLCDELLTGNPSTALTCISHLFLNQLLPDALLGLCANTIFGSLRAWAECQRQYKILGSSDITKQHTQQQQQQQQADDDQATAIENYFIFKLDLDKEHITSPETSSIAVTRRTLPEKAREMFRFIVKSGRSMYMNEVDVDAKKAWEPVLNSPRAKQVVSHYLDLTLFQAALKMTGMHWFLNMIVDEVLEAGKSGGTVRAAELGSCLLTTPLIYSGQGADTCLAMLWCLLQDVVPSFVSHCASKNTSFFQGQTLGVFVSDCLVLMYHEADDQVDKLGFQFFESLAIGRVPDGDVSSFQKVSQNSDNGSKCALWNEDVVGSPVWRGFIKGLISNPFIKEMWPNAYAS